MGGRLLLELECKIELPKVGHMIIDANSRPYRKEALSLSAVDAANN